MGLALCTPIPIIPHLPSHHTPTVTVGIRQWGRMVSLWRATGHVGCNGATGGERHETSHREGAVGSETARVAFVINTRPELLLTQMNVSHRRVWHRITHY